MAAATLVCIDTDQLTLPGTASKQDSDAALAAQMVRELDASASDLEVAYKRGVRWTRQIEQVFERDPKKSEPSTIGKGAALITGGLGGLGVVTAEALVEAGATCVVLASRSGQLKHSDQGLQQRLDALTATGATIAIEKCDVGDEAQVVALLERIRTQHGPLRVVVHAAGVLSDALLREQNEESMRAAFAAKADGAWYLHKHTAGDDLAAFIMYSSLSSVFGNRSSGNYAGANGCLDQLARHRMAQGLPGVSVQWPYISEVGMATGVGAGLSIGPDKVKWILPQLLDGHSGSVATVLPREYIYSASAMASIAPLFSQFKVTFISFFALYGSYGYGLGSRLELGLGLDYG